MSTFAAQFTAEERWVSGWNQQFAKLSYPAMGTGGSNPPFSAKERRRWNASSFFSGYGAVRLAHLLWEQGVEGSNPFAPTVKIKRLRTIATSYFFGNERNLHSICTQTFSNGYNFKYGSFVKLPIELNKKAAPFEAANAKLDNPRKMGAFDKRDKSTNFPAITNRILLRCALLPFLSPLLN